MTSGQDRSGATAPVLAGARSCCVPHRVYSADARDLLRDLNLGYAARLPKKLVNAVCWCHKACCNGTDDTSVRNAKSSVCFHAVNNAEVSA